MKRKTEMLPLGRADIIPTGVYGVDWAQKSLGLGYDSLRAQIRQGKLRAAERCGKRFFLGEWLIQWIKEGEINRQAAATSLPVEEVHEPPG